MKVSFNGTDRLINVLSGVVEINVERDLYSEWKNWLLSDNAQYAPAFRTFGGDPTSGTQNAPKYFFLTNNWRVRIDGESVVVQSNLYTEEGDSPFIVENNGSVSATNSDAQSVKSEIENIISYANMVHVDADIGSDAIGAYPYGTVAYPVKTLAGAKVIGNKYGIDNLRIHTPMTFDADMLGWRFNSYLNILIDLNGKDVSQCTFNSCFVSGFQLGENVLYSDCRIGALTNFAGALNHCYFVTDDPIVLQSSKRILITDCRSALAGNASPTFDFSNGNVECSFRAHSGGIKIINSTSATNLSSCEFIAGKFNFGESNTAGEFHVRGVLDSTNIAFNTGAEVFINGMPVELREIVEKQKVRDAMLLSSSTGETIEVDSVEDKINRIDSSTQN